MFNTFREVSCDGSDDLQENPLYDSVVQEHIYSSPSDMRLHHSITTEFNLSYGLPSDGTKSNEHSFKKEECSLYA